MIVFQEIVRISSLPCFLFPASEGYHIALLAAALIFPKKSHEAQIVETAQRPMNIQHIDVPLPPVLEVEAIETRSQRIDVMRGRCLSGCREACMLDRPRFCHVGERLLAGDTHPGEPAVVNISFRQKRPESPGIYLCASHLAGQVPAVDIHPAVLPLTA